MNYRSFIESVLEDAAKIATEKFGNVIGVTKDGDNNQVLTDADIAIGNLIIEQIKKEYPEHNIIDEEAGVVDNGSDFTWVVDPIDGTSNFASGVETYGTMIGLLEGGIPIAGGFSLPAKNKIIVAEKGKGAFINGKKLHVTAEKKLSNCLVAYHIDGHPEDKERAEKEVAVFGNVITRIRNMRNTGCEPWDGLLVAEGKYGALLNQSMKIWDAVAVHSIIEEAGGMYTDFWGKPIDYSNPERRVNENFTCCAAPSILHKQLQEIINI